MLSSCYKSNDIYKETSIDNLPEAKIMELYGPPTYTSIISLTKDKSFLEYQSDLNDIVIKLDFGDTVQIKEFYWDGPSFNRVIWLKRADADVWFSFDNLHWNADIQF